MISKLGSFSPQVGYVILMMHFCRPWSCQSASEIAIAPWRRYWMALLRSAMLVPLLTSLCYCRVEPLV